MMLSDTYYKIIYLQKYELDQSSNMNQSSEERIFLSYLVTDYISCGLSSPNFYPEFYKYIYPNKSKVKLVKRVLKLWDCLLKNYKITSMYINLIFICTCVFHKIVIILDLNAKFVKHFVVSLAHLFVKISNLVPEYKIILCWNTIIDKFKLNIKMYEQSILSSQQHLEQISNNEMQLKNPIEEKDLGIENIIPNKINGSKMNFSVRSYVDQDSKFKKLNTENLTLDNEGVKVLQSNQQCNFENLIDHSQSKKPKLSHGEANIKSGILVVHIHITFCFTVLINKSHFVLYIKHNGTFSFYAKLN